MSKTKNKNCNFMENKEKFIYDMVSSGQITDNTAKNYERIITDLVEGFENKYNKDLYSFTFDEMENVLKSFDANNRNTVESYARIISSYLNWAKENMLTNTNVLATLRPNDFIKYLTNKENYFTEKQISRWEDLLDNYQDAVIVRMLFEGIGGKEMSEIRNLKQSDINFEKRIIKLTNTLKSDEHGNPVKFTERYMHFDDDRIFTLIRGAINQSKYLKRNGEPGEDADYRSVGALELVDNDYVVRSSITKTENYNYPVDKFVIYRRIAMINEVFGIDGFTTKLIQRSGMIKYANSLMKDGKISLDDLKIIADRFNVKSYHNLKGFITVENVEKTYK